MKYRLSDKSAAAIAPSLPAMERNRQQLSATIGAYMSRSQSDVADAQSIQAAGLTIMDTLFENARQLAAARPGSDGRVVKCRFQELDLPKRSLSCFGDGLGAVMKDILRADATPEVVAGWGDAYWAIVRAEADQGGLSATPL